MSPILLAIVGTPFELEYQSDRQLDRTARNTLTIALSAPGTVLPASLKRIDVTVHVAGRQFAYCFDTNTLDPTCADVPGDHTLVFTDWDGTDVYGRVTAIALGVGPDRCNHVTILDNHPRSGARAGLARRFRA